MIKEKRPVTMAEVKEILKDHDTEKAKAIVAFIKKFSKISGPEAKKMFDLIKNLDITKLKDEDIVKIVDFMPEDPEDLRKIFIGSDISLDQDEITKILETKKK